MAYSNNYQKINHTHSKSNRHHYKVHKFFQMPENRALSGLCSGLIEAYDLFGAPAAVVVVVVEEVPYNICDQRFHEFEIAERRPDIMVSLDIFNFRRKKRGARVSPTRMDRDASFQIMKICSFV